MIIETEYRGGVFYTFASYFVESALTEAEAVAKMKATLKANGYNNYRVFDRTKDYKCTQLVFVRVIPQMGETDKDHEGVGGTGRPATVFLEYTKPHGFAKLMYYEGQEAKYIIVHPENVWPLGRLL